MKAECTISETPVPMLPPAPPEVEPCPDTLRSGTTDAPTTPVPRDPTTVAGYGRELERKAWGLDEIRNEGRRLVAFGREMLAAGGFECAVGDTLDLEG